MTLLTTRPANEPYTTDTDLLVFHQHEQFEGRKLFTRDACSILERGGFLSGRYELLDGEVIVKMGQNQPHAVSVTLLQKYLNATFGGDFVLCQLPVDVAIEDRATNRPEPDASVLVRPITEFVESPPGPGDLRLVIEVSDTTLNRDRRIKSALYARAGFPEYWILDLPGRRLIVQTEPDMVAGKYLSVQTYPEQDSTAPRSAQERPVTIHDILPPKQSKEDRG